MNLKSKILTVVALFLAVLAMPLAADAQESEVQHIIGVREGVGVDFRVNSAVIESNYRDNARFIERVDSLFTKINNDPSLEVRSIEICGTASPEGRTEINTTLSHERMQAIESLVLQHIDIPKKLILHNEHYIAWDELKTLVEQDDTLPYKAEVLEILNSSYPDTTDWLGNTIDGRIVELQKLGGGAVWKVLNDRYFVKLRNGWFIIVSVGTRVEGNEPQLAVVAEPKPMPLQDITVAPVAEPIAEPIAESIAEPEAKSEAKSEAKPAEKASVPLMNIKTNALQVLALNANLGMEFRLTPWLSLDILGTYSPYDYFRPDRKFRVLAVQPELRYWFGESLVRGHFVGVHAPVAGFNVQVDDEFRYQDPNRVTWGVGVSYGYALPLGKSEKWGVEFTIGFGYMNVVYDVYEGCHNGKYLRTLGRHCFGLTRLGVDFSSRIDNNKKSKKSKTIGE